MIDDLCQEEIQGLLTWMAFVFFTSYVCIMYTIGFYGCMFYLLVVKLGC